MFGHTMRIDLIIGLSIEDDLTIGDGEIIIFMEMVFTDTDGQIMIRTVTVNMHTRITEMDTEEMEDTMALQTREEVDMEAMEEGQII